MKRKGYKPLGSGGDILEKLQQMKQPISLTRVPDEVKKYKHGITLNVSKVEYTLYFSDTPRLELRYLCSCSCTKQHRSVCKLTRREHSNHLYLSGRVELVVHNETVSYTFNVHVKHNTGKLSKQYPFLIDIQVVSYLILSHGTIHLCIQQDTQRADIPHDSIVVFYIESKRVVGCNIPKTVPLDFASARECADIITNSLLQQ